MPFVYEIPLSNFTTRAVVWINYAGPPDTWVAFAAWLEANGIDEALRGPVLAANRGMSRVLFLCDLPRVRAWWSEHGSDDVRNSLTFNEPYAIWNDHAALVQARATGDEAAPRHVSDVLALEAVFGHDWKARVKAVLGLCEPRSPCDEALNSDSGVYKP